MSETQVTTESQVVDTDNLDTFASEFFGEKTKAEPAAKPDQVEQDSDDDGQVDPEAQKTDVDPNEDSEAEFKEAPPKKKTVQDRIDELVKQREDTKREAEVNLEKVRKEFEDKLAALAPKTQTANKTAEPQPTDLDENGDPKYELGEFDTKFVRDLTKFTFAQERASAEATAQQAAQKAEQVAAQQVLTNEWNGRVETAKESYPDFIEKSQSLLDGFGNLDQGYAGYLSTTLMQMPHGTDVLYYLAQNPTEAKEIVNSGALKATLALGRISAKFADADAQKQLAKPKISNAPTPPSVRARGTNGAFVSVAGDTDNLDDFEAEFFRKKK
jgi:hypothetical protein